MTLLDAEIQSYLNSLKPNVTSTIASQPATNPPIPNVSPEAANPLFETGTQFLNWVMGIPGAVGGTLTSFWNNPLRSLPILGHIIVFTEDHPIITGAALGVGFLYLFKKFNETFGFGSSSGQQIIINNYVNTVTPDIKPEVKPELKSESKAPQSESVPSLPVPTSVKTLESAPALPLLPPTTTDEVISGPTIEDLDFEPMTHQKPLSLEDVKPTPTFTPLVSAQKKHLDAVSKEHTYCETVVENGQKVRRCVTQTFTTEATIETIGGEISHEDKKENKKRARTLSQSPPRRNTLEYKK